MTLEIKSLAGHGEENIELFLDTVKLGLDLDEAASMASFISWVRAFRIR